MRGTVIGEPVVSQAQTKEFDEGYARTFGVPDGSAKGGRWVWDRRQSKLVPADEYEPEPFALNAPIISDRIHEGETFDDGERVRDLGSRRRRREFLKETGLVETSDVSRDWLDGQKRARERDADRRTHEVFERNVRRFYNEGRLPKD